MSGVGIVRGLVKRWMDGSRSSGYSRWLLGNSMRSRQSPTQDYRHISNERWPVEGYMAVGRRCGIATRPMKMMLSGTSSVKGGEQDGREQRISAVIPWRPPASGERSRSGWASPGRSMRVDLILARCFDALVGGRRGLDLVRCSRRSRKHFFTLAAQVPSPKTQILNHKECTATRAQV